MENGTVQIHKVEIHLRERADSNETERYFDGWIEGSQNVFGAEAIMCAMPSSRAIRWANDIERRAWKFSEAKKTHPDGTPSFARIETVRVYENFGA